MHHLVKFHIANFRPSVKVVLLARVGQHHNFLNFLVYDEVENYAKAGTVCKSQSILYKDDNVIFEVSTSQTHAPAYQSLPKSLDDSYKTKNEKYNDYYIEGEDNSKVENIYKEEMYLTSDHEKQLQNDHPYNKLVHLKQ